jgi:hypothetical protein
MAMRLAALGMTSNKHGNQNHAAALNLYDFTGFCPILSTHARN